MKGCGESFARASLDFVIASFAVIDGSSKGRSAKASLTTRTTSPRQPRSRIAVDDVDGDDDDDDDATASETVVAIDGVTVSPSALGPTILPPPLPPPLLLLLLLLPLPLNDSGTMSTK